MYDRLLDVFLAVADSGSFTKAADALYLSPTAVAKQINQLEQNTGLSLFVRSNRGIVLTDAGRVFYEEARKLIALSNEALHRAKMAEAGDVKRIRVGTSILRPNTVFLELWAQIRKTHPEFELSIVPFEDNPVIYAKLLKTLGTEIDIIAGNCDSHLLVNTDCCTLTISASPLLFALPHHHRLAKLARLQLQDLYGERIMVVYRGISAVTDAVRDELIKHSDIHILDTPDYSMQTFNLCAAESNIILITENWKNIHPMLVSIPVDWPFTMPFGLIYAKEPSRATREFLCAAQKLLRENSLH